MKRYIKKPIPIEAIQFTGDNIEETVVVEEMADIIIRLLDLWAGMQRDGQIKTLLTDALINKVSVNTSRPRMHGVLA